MHELQLKGLALPFPDRLDRKKQGRPMNKSYPYYLTWTILGFKNEDPLLPGVIFWDLPPPNFQGVAASTKPSGGAPAPKKKEPS